MLHSYHTTTLLNQPQIEKFPKDIERPKSMKSQQTQSFGIIYSTKVANLTCEAHCQITNPKIPNILNFHQASQANLTKPQWHLFCKTSLASGCSPIARCKTTSCSYLTTSRLTSIPTSRKTPRSSISAQHIRCNLSSPPFGIVVQHHVKQLIKAHANHQIASYLQLIISNSIMLNNMSPWATIVSSYIKTHMCTKDFGLKLNCLDRLYQAKVSFAIY